MQEKRLDGKKDDEKIPIDEPLQIPATETTNLKEDYLAAASEEHELDGKDTGAEQPTRIADIIGEYGLFQLSLTVLTFVRYTTLAMMTNAGPLLAPSVDFWCKIPSSVPDSSLEWKGSTNSSSLEAYLKDRCELKLKNGSELVCNSWIYSNKSGITLTDSFDLVCDRDWLRSVFQSTISVGVVLASVIWGSFSDRHGRLVTIRVCFVVSLIGSTVAYLAGSFTLFAIGRSLSSFGDLGLVVSLSTIIVEVLGSKYRGAIGIIVYTGWAFGVMLMPWLTDYHRDFRKTALTLIACHVLTLPWLMTIGESPRWLLVNGKLDEAGEELRRINRWNLKGGKRCLAEAEEKFQQLRSRFLTVAERHKLETANEKARMNKFQLVCFSAFGSLYKVGEIFQSRELAITAVTLIWTTFNSELYYMFFIMINSDIGDNIKLNYAIGGVMELLATIISIFMISAITRKLSLVSTLVIISGLCFTLAITHQIPSVSVWVLNLTKLAVSTLSSLVYVTTTEMFPTNLRQTGFGLSGTIGSFGAVVAPFVRTELVELIGMTRVMLIITFLPLSAATIIPFFLRETKGIELADDSNDFVD